MRVYAESNYVLELSLMQEEQDSCEGILSLCESSKAQLILPAFSLAEPYETLIRRDKDRKQLAQRVEAELRQLGRSKPYKAETDVYQDVASFLIRSGEEERQRLFKVRDRLLRTAEIIPLDHRILASAAQFQIEHDLSPQDALVYSSVLQHLGAAGSARSCFLTRNSHDFSDPDIEASLARYSCKILFSFQDGFNYVQSLS